MLIKIKKTSECKEHEVSDEKIYRSRRSFITQSAPVIAASSLAPSLLLSACDAKTASDTPSSNSASTPSTPKADTLTPYQDITTYNNFYEFGTDKADPAIHAKNFKVSPWTIRVEGEAKNTGTYALEDLIAPHPEQERIYRLRCVEAWSMVIPWMGFPLADLIKRLEPNSKAKYVQFETLADTKQMLGLRSTVLKWPYVEALRLDEAMHPLTLLATGIYGKSLLGQNGAPIRLVVPWKYGFKSIKSIVAIRFTEKQPNTSWNLRSPREYGFYSNVNPSVNHPRWSQKKERRIGEFRKRETLLFNGYEEVASLYSAMDLKKHI